MGPKKKGENKSCKLFIMTSDVTHQKTVDFFKKKKYFGLSQKDICFFKQASLPILNFEGKFIFESKHSLSIGPNGNGALFEALQNNKELFNIIDKNGIEYIHMVGIDNVLNKLLDPFFIGFAI